MSSSYYIHIRSSSTRRVDLLSHQPVDEGYGCNPERGDVILGEVSELGQHIKFEEPGGREILLQPGNIVAVVLGMRYSTQEFCGEIPQQLSRKSEFDLLNVGGIAGNVLSKNSLSKAPTKLLYLGHAVRDQGEKLNTFNFRITTSRMNTGMSHSSLRIIIVFGSDMDCGKTRTVGQIINFLCTDGYTVGGGKLTGTSRMKDILYMKACGAHYVLDFMDAGYPSTYQCSHEELRDIFSTFREYFTSNGCDFLVIEVADGIFQRETEMVLGCPAIMQDISMLTLAADNSVSAYGGIQYLKQTYGLVPDFVSGLITSDRLAMEEFISKFPVQFLDNTFDARESFLQIIHQKFQPQTLQRGPNR